MRHDVRILSASLALAAWAATAVLAEPVPDRTGGTTPTFGAGVEMVALNVTVTAPPRGYVRDLGPDDFVVYEDGVAQHVTIFGSGDVPIDLVLLLDLSASVRDRMDLVRSAAKGFLNTLRPEDRGAVIGFNESVRVLSPLTGEAAVLAQAVDAARATGGTSLYSAIYIALRGLDPPSHRADGPQRAAAESLRRRVLVVLSDGNDTSSLVSYDDVLESCRRSGVLLYTILLKPSPGVDLGAMLPRRQTKPSGEWVMKSLARESGARAFAAEAPAALAGIYAEIAAELSSQYLLGYVPVPREARQVFHALSVAVPGRANAQARTRLGYLSQPSIRTAVARAAAPLSTAAPSPHP